MAAEGAGDMFAEVFPPDGDLRAARRAGDGDVIARRSRGRGQRGVGCLRDGVGGGLGRGGPLGGEHAELVPDLPQTLGGVLARIVPRHERRDGKSGGDDEDKRCDGHDDERP